MSITRAKLMRMASLLRLILVFKTDQIYLLFILPWRHTCEFFKGFRKIRQVFKAGLQADIRIRHPTRSHQILGPFNTLLIDISDRPLPGVFFELPGEIIYILTDP